MQADRIHDIKHAIYNVRNCLELLEKKISKETPDEERELIEMASDEIEKAINLIKMFKTDGLS